MSHYITTSGEKVEIYQNDGAILTYDLYLYNEDIIELVLPEWVNVVYCFNNPLTSLFLPIRMENVWCDIMDGIEEQYKKEMRMIIQQKR